MAGVPLNDNDGTTAVLGWINPLSGWLCAPNTNACPHGYLPAPTGAEIGDCSPNGSWTERGLRLSGTGAIKVNQAVPDRAVAKNTNAGRALWEFTEHHDWVSGDGRNIVVWYLPSGRFSSQNFWANISGAMVNNWRGAPSLWWNDTDCDLPGVCLGGWVAYGRAFAVVGAGSGVEIVTATKENARKGDWTVLAAAAVPENQTFGQGFHGRPDGTEAVSFSTRPKSGGEPGELETLIWRAVIAVGEEGEIGGSLVAAAAPEYDGARVRTIYSPSVAWGEISATGWRRTTESPIFEDPCGAEIDVSALDRNATFTWPMGSAYTEEPSITARYIGGDVEWTYTDSGDPTSLHSYYCDCATLIGVVWSVAGWYERRAAYAGTGAALLGLDWGEDGNEVRAVREAGGEYSFVRRDDISAEQLPLVTSFQNGDGAPCPSIANSGFTRTETVSGGAITESVRIGAADFQVAGSIMSEETGGWYRIDPVYPLREITILDLRSGGVWLEGRLIGETAAQRLYARGAVVLIDEGGENHVPLAPGSQATVATARDGAAMVGIQGGFDTHYAEYFRCWILPAEGAILENDAIISSLGIAGEPGATPFSARGR